MNPLLNPITLSKVIKSYIRDVNRVWNYSAEKMERYRDRTFLAILRSSLKIEMYREKYRKISIKEIEGIKDIEKLPLITKDDLRNAFPDNLIPYKGNRKKYKIISTSGSTGKPVSIFVEPIYMYKVLIYYTRTLKEYGLKWYRDRLALIVDLSPQSGEEEFFSNSAIPSISKIYPLKNIKIYHVGEDPEKILEDLNKFKPKLIGGYPDILKILAILRNRGKGKDVKPEYIASSGAVLDRYSRENLEETFNCRVFETYGATECTPMAFECRNGNMHIQTDVVNIEFWNGKGEHAKPGELAEIVITSLLDGVTPIIRYNGLNDLLVPSDRECDCGMHTPLVERIEGRKVDSIILKDGRMIPPLSMTGIPYIVMDKLNSRIIEQFQIIQEDYDDIDILVVFKESSEKDKERVSEKLREEFLKSLGDVDVEIKEVKEIKNNRKEGIATPPPVVISKIKR